jgi:hypothetical protein
MKNNNAGGKFAANVWLTLRVTPEEKNRLAELANVVGLSVSEYMRRRFFGGRPLVPRTDETAIRELRRMGGLLKHNFITMREAWRESGAVDDTAKSSAFDRHKNRCAWSDPR